MGTIQQIGRPGKPFIKVATSDSECRCCGKGRVYVCKSCTDLLNSGYAFVLEVKDSSTQQHKKPTGYVIAFVANQAFENGDPLQPMEPGIYFVKESDLKNFLGNGYDKHHRGLHGKFLNSSPKWAKHDRRPAKSTRSVTELAH